MTIEAGTREPTAPKVLAGVAVFASLLVTFLLFAWFRSIAAPSVWYGRVAGALIFSIAAVVAWRAYSRRRLALLLSACALSGWLIPAYWWTSQNPLLWTFSGVIGWVDFAFVAWLVLAYPDGVLEGAARRWIVAALWLTNFLWGPITLLFWDPSLPRYAAMCPGCPSSLNALLVHPWPEFFSVMEILALGIFAVTGVVVASMLGLSWWRATPAGRQVYWPLQLPAIVFLVILSLFTGLEWLTKVGVETALSLPLVAATAGTASYVLMPAGVLLGMSRDRFRRGRVADLIAGARGGEDDLEGALRAVLGDPTLVLAELFPDGSLRDSAGKPVAPPDETSSRSLRWLEHEGTRLGALLHDSALSEHPRLLNSAGSVAAIVLANTRLAAERQEHLADVKASRARLVAAEEQARRRIERDLHDGAQQRLLGASLTAKLLQGQAPDPLREDLAALSTELLEAVDELRSLSHGLYPQALLDGGLPAALELLRDRSPIRVELDVRVPQRPLAMVEANVYFIVSEALANVAKHAQTDGARVKVTLSEGWLTVVVADAGVGGASEADGRSGLRGLRDRAEALGGELTITSKVNQGTVVQARLPVTPLLRAESDHASAAGRRPGDNT
ncbi:MAG: sensor histidine kinase [Actinomycetota bacterium]|nr:sensor histidine kinase [Actinomycetota bacterium]